MPKKKKKPTQRCALCRKTGHNKRRCSLVVKKLKKKKIPSMKKDRVRSISVKSFSVGDQSPHVVDLKAKHSDKKVAETVSAFRESHHRWIRREVDFAELIRQANKKNTKKSPNITVPQKTACTPINEQVWKRNIREPFVARLRSFYVLRRPGITLPKMRWNICDQLVQYINRQRLLSVTLVLAIVAIIPFPALGYYRSVKEDSARLVAASTDAFLSLQSSTVAALHADITKAEGDLNTALQGFAEAKNMLEGDHRALVYLASMIPVVGTHVSGRQSLLSAGQHLTLANTYIVKGVRQAQTSELSVTDKLSLLQSHMRSAVPHYREALLDMARVDVRVIPADYQQSFGEFKVLFAALIDDLEDAASLVDMLEVVFGGDDFRRYLVLFQNQHEIRPTGGFLGSFAIVDFQKGELLNVDVPKGGTYDLQGQLSLHVESPGPLQLVNGRWEFQDANWFPHFPASAEKLAWFYEQGRNSTVDGVITINASVIERVLRVFGPIMNTEYDLLLSADTVLQTLQREVEDGDGDVAEPKAVIASLFEQLLSQMTTLDKARLVALLSELHEALSQKEIQAFLSDKKAQDALLSFGWAGEIVPVASNQDYLLVVNANLQGQKSDADISQKVFHESVVRSDGSVVNTVRVRREHTLAGNNPYSGARNINYMRLYVPKGAILIEATGFDWPSEQAFEDHVPESWYAKDTHLAKYEREEGYHTESGTRLTTEFGKSVFGNWMIVPPGEVREVSFTYLLPFKIFTPMNELAENDDILNRWRTVVFEDVDTQTSRYSMVIQRQSGVESEVSSSIIYPDTWMPAWWEENEAVVGEHMIEFNHTLNRDIVIGAVFEEK